jgi:hypothetical protein
MVEERLSINSVIWLRKIRSDRKVGQRYDEFVFLILLAERRLQSKQSDSADGPSVFAISPCAVRVYHVMDFDLEHFCQFAVRTGYENIADFSSKS